MTASALPPEPLDPARPAPARFDPARPMPRPQAHAIARAYLPPRGGFGYRDHFYVRAKLASDPLYPGVCEALRDTRAPLLDLGCGLGLLAHALRAQGIVLPYRGVDNDAGKVARGRRAAENAGLHDVGFDVVDLAREYPAHRGSVAILDVLQFIPPEAQQRALDAAIAMLEPGAVLVIRTGLQDGSRRARITHAVDVVSRVLGWMNVGPSRYPEAAWLRAQLEAAGLDTEFTPLFGDTPFNNWRIVAKRS